MLYEKNRRLLSKVIVPKSYHPMDLEIMNIPPEEESKYPFALRLFDYPHEKKYVKQKAK